MKLLAFLGRRVSALLSTLLLVLLMIAAFVAYRLATFGQQDDSAHLEAKRESLQDIAARQPVAASRPNIVFCL